MYVHAHPAQSLHIKAGVKAALVQKLCKDEERHRNPDRANQKLTDYLTPTAQVAPAIKPTLNAFYFEHFNMVDKFDAMLGHIPVAFKVTRPELRLFLASIQTVLCNTYVLYAQWRPRQAASAPPVCKGPG